MRPPPDDDPSGKNKERLGTGAAPGTPGNLTKNERKHLCLTAVVPFVFVPLLFFLLQHFIFLPSVTNKKSNTGSPPKQNRLFEEANFNGLKLFTKSELEEYNGETKRERYLAVLGEVYDVTDGEFYKPGGGYEFFVGKDATRGFTTGQDEDDSEELFLNMSDSTIHGAVGWTMFYRDHDTYDLVGKVIGKYFDGNGHSTELRNELIKVYFRHQKKLDAEEKDKRQYPNCSRRWTLDQGAVLYCKQQENLERMDAEHKKKYEGKEFSLVPRKKWSDLREDLRCACVELEEAEANEEKFQKYDNCLIQSKECAVGFKKPKK
eukprot:augustus_masked-scaffold_41-processed-gene-0.42-mRNA-1 protein AED:0.35 eAED:0.35 QI:0/-1/0/1/-1/1/1/0/318